MIHTLKFPIKLEKTTISTLEFRDYTTAEDYLAFDRKGGVAQNHALIASMTGVDEALVRKLRGADYIVCAKICDRLIAEDEALAAEGEPEKKSPES